MRTHGRLCLLALIALPGCGGDLGLPSASGEDVDLSIVDGNGQRGTVGEELPEPLVVSVRSGSTPVPNQEVVFSIAGAPEGLRLDPDTAVTGDDGRAVAHVVLGPEAGAFTIEARLVVIDPPTPTALFEGAAVAAAPDTVRRDSPATQPGRRGEPVPEPPAVIVVDRFGNRVGGATVRWEVTSGGGEASGGTVTDADGRAAAVWTLGDDIGVHRLAAHVDGARGSPATFTAVVLF